MRPIAAICCLLAALTISSLALASPSRVFFIEGKGNNAHEAKIAATHSGMRRALFMHAEELKIALDPKSRPSYQRLKSCIELDEVWEENSGSNSYSATVRLRPLSASTLHLITELAEGKSLKQASARNSPRPEVGVIPLTKMNKSYKANRTEWRKEWQKETALITRAKICLPETLPEDAKLQHWMKNAPYEELQTYFPSCPSAVVLACAELFADQDGLFSCKVTCRLVSKGASKCFTYQTEHKPTSGDAIKEAIRRFRTKEVSLCRNIAASSEECRVIIFSLHDVDLQKSSDVISVMNSIGNITAIKQRPRMRLIRVRTSLNDFAIAEKLYENGLGYFKHEGGYRILRLNSN